MYKSIILGNKKSVFNVNLANFWGGFCLEGGYWIAMGHSFVNMKNFWHYTVSLKIQLGVSEKSPTFK